MRNIAFHIFAVLTIATCLCACGNSTGLHELNLKTDSVVIDTLIFLKGADGPKATLRLNMKFIQDDKCDNVNKALMQSGILPMEKPDSLPYSAERMKKSISKFVSQYVKDYRETCRQILEQEPDNPQQLNWKYIVDTHLWGGKDDNIVVLANVEIYEGGEQQTTFTVAKNIDRKTGKVLMLNDIFSKEQLDDLADNIVGELKSREYCFSIESLREKGFLLGIKPYATENFYLTDDGITFIYVPGEIAPSEKGEIQITVD